MGQLENISFIPGEEPCEMVAQKSSCASEKHDFDVDQTVSNKSCCEDHTVVVEGSEELNIASSVSTADFHMAAVLYALVSFLFNQPEADYHTYKNYSSPLIERDIPVLVQSFLI